MLNVARLRYETSAIFVGETAGGRPNHFGEVKIFTLPNSGLEVSYSTKYFRYSSDDTDSIAPDITAQPSFVEYRRGEDPVMNAIISYQE